MIETVLWNRALMKEGPFCLISLHTLPEPTEAFPAVTVPFFLKTGGSFANPSIVVLGFGCSSTSNITSPFLDFKVTGAISSLKCPFS